MTRALSGAIAFVVTALLLAPGTTLADETPDELLARARAIYAEEGPESALPVFEEALAGYRVANDRSGEAITIGYIGNCYKRFGDFDRALEHLNRALSMKRQFGDRLEEGITLSHLGLLFWEMAEYEKAIEHLERSIAIGKELDHTRLQAASLNNLSLVYDELGDYERSLEQYHGALGLYENDDFDRGKSDTLGNIGGVHLLLGEYRTAMDYYRQALAISTQMDAKPSMSQDLGNIALCHLGLGQSSEALETFDRALALARETGLRKEEADWLKGKGMAMVQSGRYDLGLTLHREALGVYEEVGLKRELVESLIELGLLHVLLGDLASADDSFHRAIAGAREIEYARGATMALMALGRLEWRRTRFEQAAALFREAFERAHTANDHASMAASRLELAITYRDQGRLDEAASEATAALSIARETEARVEVAGALYILGEVERLRGHAEEALGHYRKGDEIAELVGDPELGWRLAYGSGLTHEGAGRDAEALRAYRHAAAIIESVRSRLHEDRFRAGYLEDKYVVYVALVRLLLKLGRIEEAFEGSEKLRARSYLTMVNRGPPAASDDSRHREETELRERIRALQEFLEEERALGPDQRRQAAEERFSSRLAAAEREYEDLLDDLSSTDPGFAALWSLTVPPVDRVREALSADAALVEYTIDDDGIFVFVLTKEYLHATRVPIRSTDLHAKVVLLRGLIQRSTTDDWKSPAASLAALLFGSIEREGWLEGKSTVYIVPHGILHYLPFSVLVRERSGESRLLVEDYVLAYLPAAAVLVHGGDAGQADVRLLAMAPASSRLRHASREARQIGRLFAERSLVLDGNRATEKAFKRLAAEYEVVHLATHGHLNRQNPLLSKLELEPGEGEDGALEVHEILQLRLRSDLVTLSACDTALGTGYFGDVPVGDDFVGLTRAFLYAGSASVVASLWEVRDLSTPAFMQSFYEGLSKGDRAAALARAQRASWRNGKREAHPYFWAPFVLVGEAR